MLKITFVVAGHTKFVCKFCKVSWHFTDTGLYNTMYMYSTCSIHSTKWLRSKHFHTPDHYLCMQMCTVNDFPWIAVQNVSVTQKSSLLFKICIHSAQNFPVKIFCDAKLLDEVVPWVMYTVHFKNWDINKVWWMVIWCSTCTSCVIKTI